MGPDCYSAAGLGFGTADYHLHRCHGDCYYGYCHHFAYNSELCDLANHTDNKGCAVADGSVLRRLVAQPQWP